MLPSNPPKDAPPHVVIKGVEYPLGSPRVTVEVAPPSKDWIEPLQALSKVLLRRTTRQVDLDNLAQPLASIHRDQRRAHLFPFGRMNPHANLVPQKTKSLCHRSDKSLRIRKLQVQ